MPKFLAANQPVDHLLQFHSARRAVGKENHRNWLLLLLHSLEDGSGKKWIKNVAAIENFHFYLILLKFRQFLCSKISFNRVEFQMIQSCEDFYKLPKDISYGTLAL